MITKEVLEKEKLSLHLKYISVISFACICLVITLHCCQSTMFQNCISVSSTVTSIILSVVAIILSVTGERTTNEIRNKVADSVEQLEDCTEKSSQLTEELTKTLQQMNDLYANVNDKVSDIPKIKTALDDFLFKDKESNKNYNDIDSVEHITKFMNNINPKIKVYVKMAYIFWKEESSKHPIQIGDVIKYLISEGADANTANLVVGLMLGNLCTGTLDTNKKIQDLIDKL